MQEFDRDHLIEAIDKQLAEMYNEAAVAEDVKNEAQQKYYRLEESIYNLEKQRRELLID